MRCRVQLTSLPFPSCSESEILHHDKQYEPFYSSFVALSTHYITTVCGLSKCSPPLLLFLPVKLVTVNSIPCPARICLRRNRPLRQSVPGQCCQRVHWQDVGADGPGNSSIGVFATKYWGVVALWLLVHRPDFI